MGIDMERLAVSISVMYLMTKTIYTDIKWLTTEKKDLEMGIDMERLAVSISVMYLMTKTIYTDIKWLTTEKENLEMGIDIKCVECIVKHFLPL